MTTFKATNRQSTTGKLKKAPKEFRF